MAEKEYTRQQVGKMTTMDLRLMIMKEPPPEMGGKLKSAAEVFEVASKAKEGAGSWLVI